MVTVGMNYRVVPGRELEFERVFHGVLKILEAEPSHLATRLFRACDEASDYLILSEWTDRRAFEGFIGSEAFGRITSWSLDGVLSGRPTHEVYEDGRAVERSPQGGSADRRCPTAHT